MLIELHKYNNYSANRPNLKHQQTNTICPPISKSTFHFCHVFFGLDYILDDTFIGRLPYMCQRDRVCSSLPQAVTVLYRICNISGVSIAYWRTTNNRHLKSAHRVNVSVMLPSCSLLELGLTNNCVETPWYNSQGIFVQCMWKGLK